jgi:hypothetical protein
MLEQIRQQQWTLKKVPDKKSPGEEGFKKMGIPAETVKTALYEDNDNGYDAMIECVQHMKEWNANNGRPLNGIDPQGTIQLNGAYARLCEAGPQDKTVFKTTLSEVRNVIVSLAIKLSESPN